MARLDPLIDLMMKEPGAELVMETGAQAVLRSPAGTRPLIRQQLTTTQIVGACAEVVPADARSRFPGDEPAEFRYSGPYGPVRLRIEPDGHRVRALYRADTATG